MGAIGTTRTRQTTAAMAFTAILVLAACGTSPSPPSSSSPAPTSPAPSPTPSPSSPSPSESTPAPTNSPSARPTLAGAALTPVRVESSDGPPCGDQLCDNALIRTVRLAAHDGYDRFVIEFRYTGNRSTLPAYEVSYAKGTITKDPSGQPIELSGSAALLIRLTPASGFDTMATPPALVYTGPDRITAHTGTVTEAALVGDFEAVVSWVLGTRGKQPFRVLTLTNPPRLVIDVAAQQ